MFGLGGLLGFSPVPDDCKKIQFWNNPERAGWLMKQGEYVKTWRRRWFVLKEGRMFWFLNEHVTSVSVPRGVINVGKCLTIKGAEDILNRPYAFELSTPTDTLFFIADSDKEKEDWINSVGRAIVKHSRSVTDYEVLDYDSRPSRSSEEPPAAASNAEKAEKVEGAAKVASGSKTEASENSL